MTTIEELLPWTCWHHPKTGNYYTVIGMAINSTNGEINGELGVVYLDQVNGELYYRRLDEFLDGRFVKIK